MAFHALTDAKVPAETVRVLGPELLTYDDVCSLGLPVSIFTDTLEAAAKLSKALGREIVHVKLSEQENMQQYMKVGFTPQAAGFMTWLESVTAKGGEDMTNDVVLRVTGRPPKTLDEYIQENKTAWQ